MPTRPTTYQLTYAGLVELQADDDRRFTKLQEQLQLGYDRILWLEMFDVRARMHIREGKIALAQRRLMAVISNQDRPTHWYTEYDGAAYEHPF
jgi:hypothetical protein